MVGTNIVIHIEYIAWIKIGFNIPSTCPWRKKNFDKFPQKYVDSFERIFEKFIPSSVIKTITTYEK